MSAPKKVKPVEEGDRLRETTYLGKHRKKNSPPAKWNAQLLAALEEKERR